MILEQGYYKYDHGNNLILQANNVYNTMYVLLKGQQDSYDLPIDGWYFFESAQSACDFFNVDIEDHDYLIDDPNEGIDTDVT